MSLTKVYRSSRECLETETSPVPKILVDHPNLSSKFSLSSCQVRRKSSATTNIVERDSAEAEARINGSVTVAQPSEENPVILRLKKILSMKSDQTVIERLNNVNLDSLPDVEQLLESSHARYDYDLTQHYLLITMASAPHECGVRAIRRLYEPRMEILTAKYGGVWNYDTNLRFHLFDDAGLPMPLTFTPDGGISGVTRDLTLAVEIANSERLAHARNKIASYLSSRSVIAGILLNLDETPAYAAPNTQDDWDSRSAFVGFKDWSGVEVESWGPRDFAGHRWGGVYTCQIEVHWSCCDGSTRLYRASLVPLDSKENLNTINEELAAIWECLVETQFDNQIDQIDRIDIDSSDTPFLNVDAFRRALSLDLYKVAHQRYSDAWDTVNGQRRSPLASTQVDKSDDLDGWRKRLATFEARRNERDRVRKRRRVA